MTDLIGRSTPADQRALAVRLFNRTWDLLEAGPRRRGRPRAAGDGAGLAAALGGHRHRRELAAGDWLVAHVASHLGYADLALDFAAAAHQRAVEADPPVPQWLVASTQEGMARAHAVAGHDEERDRWAADARGTLAAWTTTRTAS